jgi:N-acetylmuramoyl-L-alanine amidase
MGTIVIDPGHGGNKTVGGSSPNNASGPKGTLEKTLTLDVARRTAAAVEAAGHRVELTRDSDTNLSLSDRARVAKTIEADAFVSIHFNGFKDANVQGTETWTHFRGSDVSRRLAEAVQGQMVQVTRYRDRGLFSKVLGVLEPAQHHDKTAACLVEISFITDPKDEVRLEADTYRDALGQAIASGVEDFLTSPAGFVAKAATLSVAGLRAADCPVLARSAAAPRARSAKKPQARKRRKRQETRAAPGRRRSAGSRRSAAPRRRTRRG